MTTRGFRVEGGDYGIRVDATATDIVMGNTISNTTSGHGVRADKCSNVHIENNTIDMVGGQGIRVKEVNGIVIINNSVTHVIDQGIRMRESSDGTVEAQRVDGVADSDR